MNPSFSVIIPAYNAMATLSRCLDSALAQEPAFSQIIVMDDGSTDQTAAIIQSYAARHPEISYYHHDNQGLGYTRNRGLEKVQGDYVVFLDADDTLAPEYTRRVFECLQKRDFDLVFTDYFLVQADGVEWVPIRLNELLSDADEFYAKAIQGFLGNYGFMTWTAVYRNEFLQSTQIKNGEGYLFEDQEFTVEAILCAQSAAYIREPLYQYIQTDGSITLKPGKEQARRRCEGILTSSGRLAELTEKYAPLEKEPARKLLNHVFLDLSHVYCEKNYNWTDTDEFLSSAARTLLIMRTEDHTDLFSQLRKYHVSIKPGMLGQDEEITREADRLLAEALHRRYEQERSEMFDRVVGWKNAENEVLRRECERMTITSRESEEQRNAATARLHAILGSRRYQWAEKLANIYHSVAFWKKH